MGLGDEIMGSGMARKLFAANGLKVAFGDGRNVVWSSDAELVYKNNPKVARPSEQGGCVQWCGHYRGHRAYGRFTNGRLLYDTAFAADRGEFFFTDDELAFASLHPAGSVIVEPKVKMQKVNKQWRLERYWAVADAMAREGHDVVQFTHDSYTVPFHPRVRVVFTPTIRHAAAVLAKSSMFVGPEGGLHHAAAAVNVPAVVLFGGFIHPRTTGYEGHVNLFAGGEPCGSAGQCNHCTQALDSITVDHVLNAITTKFEDAEHEKRKRNVAAG